MKLVSLNCLMALFVLLVSDMENVVNGSLLVANKEQNITKKFLEDFSLFENKIDQEIDLMRNSTLQNKNFIKLNNTSSQRVAEEVQNSLNQIRTFQNSLERKINFFPELKEEKSNHFKLKKRKLHKIPKQEDDNSYMFYNTLSLIMLSLLAGGLVGIIFILYFSFK